jgi:hypothetical protein
VERQHTLFNAAVAGPPKLAAWALLVAAAVGYCLCEALVLPLLQLVWLLVVEDDAGRLALRSILFKAPPSPGQATVRRRIFFFVDFC